MGSLQRFSRGYQLPGTNAVKAAQGVRKLVTDKRLSSETAKSSRLETLFDSAINLRTPCAALTALVPGN